MSDTKTPPFWRGLTGPRLTALLTAIVAIGPFSISFYVPSLPDIALSLNATPAQAQATMTTYLAGFAFAQLVYGPLSDRFGRRPILIGALILFILASALCAATQTIEQLQLARMVQGFGACCGPVLGRAMVRDLFQGTAMVRVFSVIGTAIALAPAVAPSLGGFIEQALGWQASFLALGLFGMTLLFLALRFLDESNQNPNPEALQPRRLVQIYASLLVNPVFMGHVLVGALTFAGIFSYHASTAFIFMEELGLSPSEFGLLAFITVPAYASGNIITGKLAAKVSKHVLVGIGVICTVSGSILVESLSDTVSLTRVIAPMLIYFFGFGLILAHATAGALQPFPRVAGSASATMGFIQMACGALATFGAGYFYAGNGAGPLGLILLGFSALAGLCFFTLVPRKAPISEK